MKQKKVLIIEDDHNLAAAIEVQWRMNNWLAEVRNECQSIDATLIYLRQDRPDAIILDVIQPDCDGFQLLREIKAHEELKHIPLVVFTDYSEKDRRTRCHNLGADYFFIKNEINAEDFVQKILKIFKNKQIFES